MNAPPVHIYEFGDFRLDAEKRLLSREGVPVPVTSRVFETLLYLVEHHDTVLDKERLMEAVWPDSIVEENNLTQNISTLRRVFGETPGSHRYIVTVPGRGYRFVAEVQTRENSGGPKHLEEATITDKAPGQIETASVVLPPSARPRYPRAFIVAFFLLGLAAFLFFRSRAHHEIESPAGIASSPVVTPEKSIAVLPFANLSAEQENAFFTEGVQDDILTALAKIADLKVISRTSVASYIADPHRNLRDIGRELGVSQILEGSVRRAGDRVRVTAQLIDTRTYTHVWAETYDRNLADVFAIQSEIAQQIATQLQAKLSPNEKATMEERPTNDLAAYDLYLRAKTLWGGWRNGAYDVETLLQAASVLDQAVTRDPEFFSAYVQLARTHDAVYFYQGDHTPARLALAEAALAAAERLRPDSGEVHLVRAEHLYRGYLDYEHARAELALAQRTLPNNAEIFALMAHIDRRQGRWSESTRNYDKALELSPRDPSYLGNAAVNYEYQRRFAEAVALRDRVLKLDPRRAGARLLRAAVDLAWRADPRPLHETIETIVTENPMAAAEMAEQWLDLALCEHNSAMADRALAAMKPGEVSSGFGGRFSRAWFEGQAARARGDAAAARAAFASARVEAEAAVVEQPDYGPRICMLGMIDAALGRKEDAIREGRRAAELLPVTKSSMEGATIMEYLGIIYAWTGEKDLAIEQVAATVQIPSALNYGRLRLHPFWDPLRGDARFEKIVASLAPK